MTRENLQSQRPSKDRGFIDAVGNNLQVVQRFHEGLLPGLKTLFSKALERKVEVEICEAHQRMFGFFIQSMEKHCCTYFFKMEPLKGWVYFDLSLPLCAAVLQPDADDDRIKGRVAEMLATPIGEEARILSKSEVDTLHGYVKDIIAMLVEAWKPVREITITDAQLETAPPFIFFESAGDSAIHLIISVKSEGHEDLRMTLCYLMSTLEPALPGLN